MLVGMEAQSKRRETPPTAGQTGAEVSKDGKGRCLIDCVTAPDGVVVHAGKRVRPTPILEAFLILQKRTHTSYLWMSVGFFLLLFLRRSAQLLHPQVWDEDGTQIIPGFLNHGLMSFGYPVNGYLVTVPKLIIGASMTVSSLFLPLVSTVVTWLFIVGVCVAIAVSPTWLKGRMLICLVTLLVPTDPEVFGIPLYSFWWASLLLFLVVLWDERSSDIGWRLIFVLIAGLSSPVIFLVTPFLAIRTLLFKPRVREAIVLSTAAACCVIQGIASHNSIQPMAHGAINAYNLRLIVPTFVGSYLVGDFPHTTEKLLWFSAGLLVAFLVGTTSFVIERPSYLFLLGLWIGAILLSTARVDLLSIHPRLGGPRYFFFPYVLLSWYLVSVLVEGSGSGIKWAAGALLLLSTLNTFHALSRSHYDFRWTDHVVSCSRFDHYAIPISFDGYKPWFLDLDRDHCELLQHWGLISSRRRLSEAKSYPYRIRTIDSKALNSEGLNEPGFVSASAVVEDHWKTTGDSKGSIPGFKIFDSVRIGEAGHETLTLRLRKGEKVLFRSGPEVGSQGVSIRGEGRFLQRLPPITDWIILDFSNNSLPDEFTVSFSDTSASSGEWSAVALRP